MEESLNIINNLDILEEDVVVLACSYGPDSMCLLDLLIKANINVVVAHVNHKVRKESDQEYLDLKNYCNEKNIVFEGTEIKEIPSSNLENYFRCFRYDFFKKIVKKYNAKYLFTAHHGDDLVETILMRLSRGASFRGYAGFGLISKTKEWTIVRPLIYVTKEEILNYVKKNNIPYAIDESNLDTLYTRNKYRHNVLPVLKEINPKIHKKFIKFSDTIQEYSDYVDFEVEKLYSELYLNNRLDLNEFNELPLLLKKNLLRRILLGLYGNNINRINDRHLDLILELTMSDKRNSYVCLPDNLLVNKYYNIVEFVYQEEIISYDIIFDKEYSKDNWTLIQIDNTNIVKSNYLIRLNSNDIKLPLHIRNRMIGDKIELKNGTKKIGEILSESKMPKKYRDTYPIVVDDEGKILWIPGIKKSKFDKQDKEDYDIIVKYIKKGDNYEK